jgi:hypothetical protein
VNAFAGSGIDLSFQGTNYYVDKGNRQRMNDYAADQGLGLQHSKWHPDWEDMAVACTSCWSRGTGQVDAPLRWENQVSFAIEQPDLPLIGSGQRTVLNNAEEDYWNLAAFLDLKGDMYKTRLYPRGTSKRITMENPHVQDMLQAVNDLAGTDERNAPYAQVWMRETEWGWWPKCNNFDFYLYASTSQEPRVGSSCPGVDNLTVDGRAVAVTNLDDLYAPGTCPNDRGLYSAACDPRYRYARKTMTSHPYIYLDVDPKYRYGVGINAIIYIDYLDVGTDEIKLQWHNGSSVQTAARSKTDSRQWRTWTLDLTGMDLTNRFVSGSTSWDFRIWDAGDGAETIHSVKFLPLNSGTTPTTPTPTPTRTPTPATTATPWLMRVSTESNSWQDALIWVRYSDQSYVGLQSYTVRMSSYDGGSAMPPEYPTTLSSLLIEADFDLPVGATVNRATLYLTAVQGFLPSRMNLTIRPVINSWGTPTWNSRVTQPTVVPWQIAGAYGVNDVESPVSSISISSSDVLYQTTLALDVTGAVLSGGGLLVKLEPSCVPSAATGICEGFVSFAGSANQNLGIRPYLELDLIGNAAPTATPTPTRTPTPLSPPASTATPIPAGTPTPYPPSLREGLVINEVCTNPVTTDNVPDGIIQGDSAVELFNSSELTIDLSDYRLCINTSCVWLSGSIKPFGYKVYYEKWDKLTFNENGVNIVKLYMAGVSPSVLVDTLTIQNQTSDYCWAATTDASPTYIEKYPPTLGRGNSLFD